MTHARLNLYTGSLTFLVIALAIINWNLTPESASSWIAAMVTMPVIWVVASVKMKLSKRTKLNEMELKFFSAAVIFAGLLLVFSLAMRLAGTLFDIEMSLIDRARNVFSGFVLLYFANMMPKLIGPALKGKCSNTSANSVRRFAGWALVIGALGYIGAWIFAPISQASILAQICVGGAVILVMLRILYAFFMERKAEA
ncbi:MAG: hypothetical protein ABJN22_04365 [Litorimonas sp.]